MTADDGTGSRSRSVGWLFAPAGAAAMGFQAGAVFAINQFYPRSALALVVILMLTALTGAIALVGWRTRGLFADIALGVGAGGLLATVVVGLVTSGGAS
ncbi:hypothetical protein [Williamsia sp. CHRR-6]|uniref:hypothetical protein n=1 Tax=Williamsia sp. CHRR-6 TaxID=2835871 RepID=UPI001BDAF8D4|nr:hypothetical protein [Williamsia sp. CHRR-6]MBT0566063.1 hypothetical protein [Williamsia sp. CHRR-6]